MAIWPEPRNGSFQCIKASNWALGDQLQQFPQAEQRRRELLEAVLQVKLVDPQADLALVGRA
jgi:hypothetical protein